MRLSHAFLLAALVSCGGEAEDTAKPGTEPASAPAPKAAADTVYTNGKIYTVNQTQPWVEAVAIKDGKFLVVGSNADVEAVTGEDTEVVDLEGRMAMPGLIDSHTHPMDVATGWANLRITDPTDVEAILRDVREYAAANPDAPMIRGEAWNLGVFPSDSPRRELLDEIDSERPIYLVSQTGHSAWANSKALELAGITKDTPITDKFIYDADPDTGEPSGTLREFAMGAVERVLPPTPPEVYAPALQRVLAEFSAYGFTSIKNAGGARGWVVGAALLETQGGLNVRLFPSWEWRSHYSPHSDEEQDALILGWQEYETELISPRYVKMFYDGGPDSYTALLLEDYVGRPGFKGQSHQPKEVYLEKIAELNAAGLGLIVHVLGDGGGRELVDIFTEVRERNGDNGVPLHFSHAWMTRPEDIQSLAEVEDACIDFSPVLAYPSPLIVGSFVPPLGEERYQKFFNVRSAFETGMPVGLGSDWASSLIPEPNGFHQMQSWITRRDPQDPSSGSLNADQAITLEQAIYGYTLGGAECLGFDWAERLGSVEKDKLADFIVLDRNLFEIPIEELYLTQVDLTILGGKVVFDRAEEVADLDVVTIEITNPNLQNAVDAADLNLLVQDELGGSGYGCFAHEHEIGPGARMASEQVNQAFEVLADQGYRFARPARTVYWKNTDSTYWIQWTVKDDAAVLWAYDPESRKAVEVLQVRE